MSDNKKKQGFTQIPNHILDELIKVRMNDTEHAIINIIIRQTFGYNNRPCHDMSYSFFEKATKKEINGHLITVNRRSIIRGLKDLKDRNIIINYKDPKAKTNVWGLNQHYSSWIYDKKSLGASDKNVIQKRKEEINTSDKNVIQKRKNSYNSLTSDKNVIGTSDKNVIGTSDKNVIGASDKNVTQKRNYINKSFKKNNKKEKTNNNSDDWFFNSLTNVWELSSSGEKENVI